MRIGITGATGQLGQLVVDYLKTIVASTDIVALVRDSSKAEGLGVEARLFDYNKPEIILTHLKGIDRLLLISGNEIGKRVQQHENVILAAKAAGVGYVLPTFSLGQDISSNSLRRYYKKRLLLMG
jgi:NAD(P)H dehydrogenase (quinone)